MRRQELLVLAWVCCLVTTAALGFNPLAHLEIAQRAFSKVPDPLNRDYGAIASDLAHLAVFVAQPSRWPDGSEDTHYTFSDLRPYSWSRTERSFALGWLAHNEYWGADFVGHREFNGEPGYVTQRAWLLANAVGIDENLAHLAIETAVDVLLKRDHPDLVQRLLQADLYRSPEDHSLLTRILVWRNRQTDWWTLTSTELEFRCLVGWYAVALSQPEPQDLQALADLAVRLGELWLGTTADPTEIIGILQAAMELCEDYESALDAAVDSIGAIVP